MISSISALILVVLLLLNQDLLWIPASVTGVATVNPNGIKTLLVNGVSIFFINSKSTLINDWRNLIRNPLDCIMLDSRVFDNFMLVDELFAKALHRLEICLSVNNDTEDQYY